MNEFEFEIIIRKIKEKLCAVKYDSSNVADHDVVTLKEEEKKYASQEYVLLFVMFCSFVC